MNMTSKQSALSAKSSRWASPRWLAAAAAMCLVGGTLPAFGAKIVWTGGGDPDFSWSVTNNWDSAQAPAEGDDIVFPSLDSSLVNPNNDLDSLIVNSITFTGSGYTLGGNPVTVNSGITNAVAALNDCTMPLILGASQTFSLAGNSTFTGDLDLGANTLTVIVASDKTVTYTGVISGAGGITKKGAGTFKINTIVHTYTGKTLVTGGILYIDREWSLGGNPTEYTPDQLTLDGGTLQINNNLIFGANNPNSGIYIGSAGGTFLTDNGVVAEAGCAIDGTGSLTKTGPGTLKLSAYKTWNGTVFTGNTYTGKTIVNAGILSVKGDYGLGANPSSSVPDQLTLNGGTLVAYGTFTNGSNRGVKLLSNNGTIAVDPGETLTVTNVITGVGMLTNNGNGALTLSGANDYSGGTVHFNGLLNINHANALGTGTFTINGGTIDNTSLGLVTLAGVTAHSWNANFTFTGTQDLDLGTSAVTINASRAVTTTTPGKTLTVGGAISESGAGGYTFTKAGAGTLKLTAANNYTGNTTVSAGVLSIDGEDRLGSNPATFTAARLTLTGTLNAFGSFSINANRGITLSGSSATISVDSGVTLEIDKGIAGGSSGNAIPLTKAGSGTLKLAVANTYRGKTIVSAGTLSINDETCLAYAGSTSSLVADQLTIKNNATLNAYGSFTIDDTYRGVTLGTGGGIMSADSGVTMIVAKVIAGSGNALTKAGLGTVNLTQPNTYSGTTTVSAGKLLVNGSTASGSAVTVASTATLGGVGTVGGTVVANGTLAPGNSPGTLTTAGETWNGGGIYEFQITNATSTAGLGWDLLNNTGSLTVGATSGNQFTIKVVSLDASGAANPAANFDNTANYTWLIATNDGGVTGFPASSFLIDTNGFKNDQGPGRFLISQSGKNVYLQFGHVTANAATASRAWGTYVRISKSAFLASSTSGGTGNRTLLSVTSPVAGDFVDYSGSDILYAPVGNTNTVLGYTVSDSSTPTAFTATNTLTVLVTNAVSVRNDIQYTNGTVTIRFAGIPTYSYVVERASDVNGTWTVVTGSATNAPSGGVWVFTDSSPLTPHCYYRTKQNNTLE